MDGGVLVDEPIAPTVCQDWHEGCCGYSQTSRTVPIAIRQQPCLPYGSVLGGATYPSRRSKLRRKNPAATRTINEPGARCSARDSHVPSVVEAIETATEMTSMPRRLRASRLAVAAGMMTSQPDEKNAEEAQTEGNGQSKDEEEEEIQRRTLMPVVL